MTRTHKLATHLFAHIASVLTLAMTVMPAPAAAQTAAPAAQPPEKKWSLVRGRSLGGNGIAPVIEDAMRAADFDDETPRFLGSGAIGYPFSGTTSTGAETDLTYRHSRRLAFGLRKTSVGLGSTHGHQDESRYLYVSSKVSAYAPIAYFRVNRNLRIGAGPLAASTVVFGQSGAEQSSAQSFKSTVYGGLVTASLEGQFLRYFVLGFNASRTWIPEVTVGPFTADGFSNGSLGTATLPAMRLNLSHHTFGLSLGVRF